MNRSKRDPKVSPSDEDSDQFSLGSGSSVPQSDELPLVAMETAGDRGNRPRPRSSRKRTSMSDVNEEDDEMKEAEFGGEKSGGEKKYLPPGHGNFAFFGDAGPATTGTSSSSSSSAPQPRPRTKPVSAKTSTVPTVSIVEPGKEETRSTPKTPRFADVAQKVFERELISNPQDSPKPGYGSSIHIGVNGERRISASYGRRRANTNTPNDIIKEFVSKNIFQRRCIKFVKDEKWQSTDQRLEMCCCGRLQPDHTGHVEQSNGPWKIETCTTIEPANSFGQIEFVGYGQGKKKAPYVRVDYKTDPEIIWKLLTEHWRLKPPNVLISVTGGAKDFILKDRLRALFHKGLMKAATSTGAWIISGGTAEGVMKVVGEAVNEEGREHTHDDEKPVYALGIATWGIVDNREALDGSRKHNNLWPAMYPSEGLRSVKNSAALDCNHTHFILVDDGRISKYGADIELRATLEKYIANEKFISEKKDCSTSHCERVPVVLVVVEGGPNTLKTVYESTEKNMPAVIVEGSGRAADVIAYAYKKTKPSHSDSNISRNVDRNDVKQWVTKAFKLEPKDSKIEQYIDWVQACIRKRNLITVFRMQDADTRDIDGTILHALLKARSGSAQTQLNLALAWNRSDIARQEIFTAERRKEWQKIDLEDAMLTALTMNRVAFVQLLMDHGIVLRKFLSIKRLHQLYFQALYNNRDLNEDTACTTLELLKTHILALKQTKQASSVLSTCCGCCKKYDVGEKWACYLLHFIGKVLTNLMGDEYPLSYAGPAFVVEPYELTWRKQTQRQKMLSFERENFTFDYPEQELFLWAILLNMRTMARLFWLSTSTHMGSALVAAKILRALSKLAASEEEVELYQDLTNHSMDYQLLAKDVLTECYNKDKRKSQQLVIRQLPNWGHTTCLSIADSAYQMEFMDHSCCQTKLNRIWKGNMHLHTSWWRLILALIPFFIFLIKFSTKEEDLDDMAKTGHHDTHDATSPAHHSGALVRPSLHHRSTGISLADPSLAQRQSSRKIRKLGFHTVADRLSIFRAIWYYYTAPVTKFLFNVISYVIFLFIFGVFLMTNLNPIGEPDSPSKWEWITIVWVFSLTVEEGRQIMVREAHSLRYKIRSWIDDVWNRFDLAMISLFCLSLILRFSLTGPDFMIARISYCLTHMVFMFRLLHMGFFQKEIGPKIIMIKKMLEDLVFFVVILIVFIMAFGVACEALLYPNHEPSLMLIPKVIYKPYWQMYGELFLEEMEGRLDNETCYSEPRLNGHCPPMDNNYRWVVPLLTAVYMLISNVLLLNLLIAMFSFIFQKVNDKSETIWRFYRYELVYEYFDRPTLVPPLILFNHLWRLLWYIVLRCKGEDNPSTDFRVRLDDDDFLELNNFEKRQVENYFIKKHHKDQLIPEVRMLKTGQRLDKVITEIEDIRETILGRWTESQVYSHLMRGDSNTSLHDRRPMVRRAITDSLPLFREDRFSSRREQDDVSPMMRDQAIPEIANDDGACKDDLEERVGKIEENVSGIMDVLKSIQSTQQELLQAHTSKGQTTKKTKEIHHVYYTPQPPDESSVDRLPEEGRIHGPRPDDRKSRRRPDKERIHREQDEGQFYRLPDEYTVQRHHQYHRQQRSPVMEDIDDEEDEDAELLEQYLPRDSTTFREQLMQGIGSAEAWRIPGSEEPVRSDTSDLTYREQLIQGIVPALYAHHSDEALSASDERVAIRPRLQPQLSLKDQILRGAATTTTGLRPSDDSSSDVVRGRRP
ncbi:transient receptor potential cation channel subfamily M member-like 2 [Glandiceps talaboti]